MGSGTCQCSRVPRLVPAPDRHRPPPGLGPGPQVGQAARAGGVAHAARRRRHRHEVVVGLDPHLDDGGLRVACRVGQASRTTASRSGTSASGTLVSTGPSNCRRGWNPRDLAACDVTSKMRERVLVPTLDVARSSSEKMAERTSRMVASSSSTDSAMRSRARSSAMELARRLQPHAHREQPLDDVVVEVAGDALAVGHHGQLLHVRAHPGQVHGQAGLAGEVLRAGSPRWRRAHGPGRGPTVSTPARPLEVVSGTHSKGPIASGSMSSAHGGGRRPRRPRRSPAPRPGRPATRERSTGTRRPTNGCRARPRRR